MMKKVKDIDGKVVTGLFRNPNGTLVVNNEAALKKYQSQINDKQKIIQLEREILEMKTMMQQLLQK